MTSHNNEDIPRNTVYETAKSWQIWGSMAGQALWVELSDSEKAMCSSWCRASGNGNTARTQQLKQMLRRYLATHFPASEGQPYERLDTRVSWGGDIDFGGSMIFTVSKKYPSARSDCAAMGRILTHVPDADGAMVRAQIKAEKEKREREFVVAKAESELRIKKIRESAIRDLEEKGAQIMSEYASQGFTDKELKSKRIALKKELRRELSEMWRVRMAATLEELKENE